MFIVTNRKISGKKGGFEMFKKTPNPKGPNELRLLDLKYENDNRVFTLLADRVSKKRLKEINQQYGLDLDAKVGAPASLDAACRLYDQVRDRQKQILVFVHGYNNDMEDIVITAEKLERLYDVIVVIFSWPANGGGVLSGTASYLDDKRDARVSTAALNRFFEKLHHYHAMLVEKEVEKLWAKAMKSDKKNNDKARSRYVRLQQESCRVKINLLCHSMGNYVLKYATVPSDAAMVKPIFDNVCLVAADANNKDHHRWVEKIEARSNVYIVINENDSALKWSRVKPGEEQLARLGHYLKGLDAKNASYIDVTHADGVGDEHSYFKDEAVEGNAVLKRLFSDLFEGRKAETTLSYKADLNAYSLMR